MSDSFVQFGMGGEVRDPGSVVFVVVATVGELFVEPLADKEAVVGIDR